MLKPKILSIVFLLSSVFTYSINRELLTENLRSDYDSIVRLEMGIMNPQLDKLAQGDSGLKVELSTLYSILHRGSIDNIEASLRSFCDRWNLDISRIISR